METLKEQILTIIETEPGLTDKMIAERLRGIDAPQQYVNQVTRSFADKGRIARKPRSDARIGNYPNAFAMPNVVSAEEKSIQRAMNSVTLSEDQVKRSVQQWLEAAGWQVSVKWGHVRGIDVEANRDGGRWIIEAKGSGSYTQMRGNYFLNMLGELLQRMDDPNAHYSIALPDLDRFRRLWQNLPVLAKTRTSISALFVDESGQVVEKH